MQRAMQVARQRSADRGRPPLMVQSHVRGSPSSPLPPPLHGTYPSHHPEDPKPFRSTSLEERSRTPSPRRTPRTRRRREFQPEYYGTHDMSRRSRSPSPASEDSVVGAMRHAQRRLPLVSGLSVMPEIDRSPTISRSPARMMDDEMAFPKLMPSPTNMAGYPRFFPPVRDMAYDSSADEYGRPVGPPMIARGRLPAFDRYPPPPMGHIRMGRHSPPLVFPAKVMRMRHQHSYPLEVQSGMVGRPMGFPMEPATDPYAGYGSAMMRTSPRRSRVIRAQPGNIPLSDSDAEDWVDIV